MLAHIKTWEWSVACLYVRKNVAGFQPVILPFYWVDVVI